VPFSSGAYFGLDTISLENTHPNAIKNCRICRSPVKVLHPFKKGFSIYHCQKCNTDLMYPIPTFKDIESSTDSAYFEAFNDPSVRNFKVLDLERALSYIQPADVRSYLDVGCAKGFLVGHLLKQKIDAYGIELFSDIAKQAQDMVGRNRIINDGFETYSFNKKFDLITMFDFIEHVKDPSQTLKKAKSILTPSGTILIITPNIDSWKRRVFKQYWTAYHIEHIHCFSGKSMELLAKKAGLQYLKFIPFQKTVNLHYFVRQLGHKFAFLAFSRILTKIKYINFNFKISDDSMLVVLKNEK